MDNLLGNEFVDYYYDKHRHALTDKTLDDVRKSVKIEKQNTQDTYFEISDVSGSLILYQNRNSGTSRYNNGNGYSIAIINYDKFLTSLPNPVQRGKQRCDIIMYPIEQKTDFLLVEIKKSANDSSKSTANKQLLDTLEMLITVPEIEMFIKTFRVKLCCRFIKKVSDPEPVIAPSAFSRPEKLSKEGSKLSNPEIERYGFELYRFLDSQSHAFNQGSIFSVVSQDSHSSPAAERRGRCFWMIR